MLLKDGSSDAQTSVDFLIGVSIFAVTLLFVLQVASTSVVNVAPQSQTREAIAERTGTIIHQEYAENESYTINNTNKTDFGVPSEYSFNATVRNPRTDTVINATGSRLPGSANSRVAGVRRVVDVGENTSVVDIRIWGGT